MDAPAKLDDAQMWFRPAVGAARKLAVIAADDTQRDLLSGRLSSVSTDQYWVSAAGSADDAVTARILSMTDVAVFVIDVTSQLTHDLRQKICLATFLGPSRLILVISGTDDTDAVKAAADRLERAFMDVARGLGAKHADVVPIASSTTGGPISPAWYQGPELAALLTVDAGDEGDAARSLRALVSAAQSAADQLPCEIVAGGVSKGDAVKILPGGRQIEVIDVRDDVGAGTVMLTTDAPANARPGSVVCAAGDPVVVSDQFESNVAWFGAEPMLPGRQYVMRFASDTLDGTLAHPKHVVNVETLEHLAAKTLEPGEIGVCNLSLEADVPFTPFEECPALGGFVIIDKFTDQVVGAGAINFELRRASNIHWQALDLNKATRAGKLGQKSSVLWFTGLSGSGKSTIANLVEKKLYAMGHQTYLLDGDNVRHGLNRDLGFTDADRVENIRRVAEVAKLMADAGLIVLASFISPFRSERRMARDMMDDGEFLEVFVEAPLEVCEQRDVKGLYVKARRGEIKNFTGIDSDYELPELADIILDTTKLEPEQSADEIIAFLTRNGRLSA